MNFIDELKTRRDLLKDSENLIAVSECFSLDKISQRTRSNPNYQAEIEELEQRKYRAYSSCLNRN